MSDRDEYGCTPHTGADGTGYSVPAIRAEVLTQGLDPKMSREVEVIMGCFDRASDAMEQLITSANGGLPHEYEALWMVLTNFTNGAIYPIMQAVQDGHHPICAFKGVMSGIAGLAFMAGVESNKVENGMTPPVRAAQPPRETVADAPSDSEFADLIARLSKTETEE